MKQVKRENYINVKSWMDLGDCNYENDHADDSIPDEGVVYCNIEHIPDFFKKCNDTENKYVVISAFSDFGLAYQQQHPVAKDMLRWIPFVEHHILEQGYNPLVIPPRCDPDNCNLEDMYSIKCYSFTMATVPSIPDNVVKWFLVNPLLSDDRIQGIPIGIGKDASDDVHAAKRYSPEDKKNLLYINWQNYTVERQQIKYYFKAANFSWSTVIDEPKDFKEYLDELSEHAFCLCPEGNGIDSYRILECIYLGVIPIVLHSPTTRYLSDLPILIVDSLSDITFENLESKYKDIKSKMESLDMADLSYWKSEIESARNLIQQTASI